MLILWAGIAAFVWIGLYPPMETGLIRREDHRHIDTPRLIGRLAVVIVLTGGLLWTEAQVRPWVRRRARVTPGHTP
jgi:hypothetical protein